MRTEKRFGFCPQLACGKARDNSVENLWAACRQLVDRLGRDRSLIRRLLDTIPKPQLILSLIPTAIPSISTPIQHNKFRLQTQLTATYPRYPQHPQLPFPYMYKELRMHER